MPDDLPSPIGPDFEKILAKLFPPAVQDLVATSEGLMHKEITEIQMNTKALIEGRVHEEALRVHDSEHVTWDKANELARTNLQSWFKELHEELRQIIAWQQDLHRKRVKNILEWWEDYHGDTTGEN